MNHDTYKLDTYAEKSPKMATFIVLYGNLIINIFCGVIYVLLHETLFLETWNTIAVWIAFTEAVILFYTVITLHDKKFFMLGSSIFMIVLSSSFIIIHISHLIREHDNWTKDWDRYIANIVVDINHQLGDCISENSMKILSKYTPSVIESFILIIIIFKYYSAWAIYRSELKRKLKTSTTDLFLFGEIRKTCQPVIVSSA